MVEPRPNVAILDAYPESAAPHWQLPRDGQCPKALDYGNGHNTKIHKETDFKAPGSAVWTSWITSTLIMLCDLHDMTVRLAH